MCWDRDRDSTALYAPLYCRVVRSGADGVVKRGEVGQDGSWQQDHHTRFSDTTHTQERRVRTSSTRECASSETDFYRFRARKCD